MRKDKNNTPQRSLMRKRKLQILVNNAMDMALFFALFYSLFLLSNKLKKFQMKLEKEKEEE